jgi:hypothetical protein
MQRLLETAYERRTPIRMGIMCEVCPIISKIIIAIERVRVTPPATEAAPTIA